jgi:iron complex outermembrane receptor protein
MRKTSFFLKPRLLLVITYLLLLPCFVFAQQYQVTGKVTDSTGTGLEKVSVRIKGRSTGTATAADGTFSITAPSSNATLIISN